MHCNCTHHLKNCIKRFFFFFLQTICLKNDTKREINPTTNGNFLNKLVKPIFESIRKKEVISWIRKYV